MEKRLESLEEAWELTKRILDEIQQVLERQTSQLHPTDSGDRYVSENNGRELLGEGKIHTRFACIDLPCFDGTEPLEFLYQ